VATDRLFVGDLSQHVGERDLADAFGQYGKIREVRLIRDRHTGRNRGFAFVIFNDSDSVDRVVAKRGQLRVGGRKCNVERASVDKPGGFRCPEESNSEVYNGGVLAPWAMANPRSNTQPWFSSSQLQPFSFASPYDVRQSPNPHQSKETTTNRLMSLAGVQGQQQGEWNVKPFNSPQVNTWSSYGANNGRQSWHVSSPYETRGDQREGAFFSPSANYPREISLQPMRHEMNKPLAPATIANKTTTYYEYNTYTQPLQKF